MLNFYKENGIDDIEFETSTKSRIKTLNSNDCCDRCEESNITRLEYNRCSDYRCPNPTVEVPVFMEPVGLQGPRGIQGPRGPEGPRGPAGKVEAYGTFIAYGGNIIPISETVPLTDSSGVTPVGLSLDAVNHVVMVDIPGLYDVFASFYIELGLGGRIQLNVNGVSMMHLPPIIAIGQVAGSQILYLNRGDKLTLSVIGAGITFTNGIGGSIKLVKIG